MKQELRKVKHSVLDQELDTVARKCHGFSSAETTLIVQKATQFCMDKVLSSQQFVQHKQNPMLCHKDDCAKWHICLKESPTHKSVVQDPTKNLVEFCVPSVTAFDLLASVKKSSKTVDPHSLYEYQQFGKDNGMDIKEPLAKKREGKGKTNMIPYCHNCECHGCESQR